jgi:hypothetical protein
MTSFTDLQSFSAQGMSPATAQRNRIGVASVTPPDHSPNVGVRITCIDHKVLQLVCGREFK